MPPIIGDPDELTTAIRHMAGSDARRIREEAEKKAEQKRKEAEGKAGQIREEILADARARAEEIRRQRRVEMTREEKSDYLKLRESLMDDVWEAAEKRLRELTEKEDTYTEILRRLALSAVPAIGPGEVLLSSDEQGHNLLTDERLADWSDEASAQLDEAVTFTRADEPADTWGGLIVMDKNGRRRIDQTFAGRLEAAREEIRNEVFNKLVTS